MTAKYREYNQLSLPEIAQNVLEKWEKENTFGQSVSSRDKDKPYVFFEGPPSANGLPGIHHVMGRTIKDVFCRYKTLQGYRVERKAGWDTHGLPVELGVEKELGITKEDIGKKISEKEYNDACRKAVMKYTDIWNDLTQKMGYWVDMEAPYITYKNKYIESVWWLLRQIYDKNLLYKGYTIQPYSPKAGTGLSTHELNMPGCYRDVTDTTIVAQFKVKDSNTIKKAFGLTALSEDYHFIAWTTTPWTLPSNTALAVGPKIKYVLIATRNQYTHKPIHIILAKDLVTKQLAKGSVKVDYQDLSSSDQKETPYALLGECQGTDLEGIEYEQLLPYALPHENADKAFRVIKGDFVTTEDGTGIVHIAPTFGADDAKVAKEAGVPAMLLKDEDDNLVPLVDLQGRFTSAMGELAGLYVKNEYYEEGAAPEKSVDVTISIQLKKENKAFKVEKYVHSYPHCWRTDKPVLYYPLDSWFIKITDVKQRMSELNKTINWKPEATGTGRFGNWLENANDWNLSRSRYWGIPIPIWRTEDGKEEVCIGSIEQLQEEANKSVKAGCMDKHMLAHFNPQDFSESNYDAFDLHKNHVDQIILVSPNGKPMHREADLIDVWFDSGSMPIAQHHYPFENKELIDENNQGIADFIAEGVDQTRGWFYTLHAISSIVFDRVAYKNVISNGLVLDKKGQKMSKRLGNATDPFTTISKYGADATRWYMITNAQPWDNLKFDENGIVEVQRKFFGTLYNTYNGFFATYANIDNFKYTESEITLSDRPEIDRWILSRLNTLIKEVTKAYETYEPTRAGRLIQTFAIDELSNWYVRLCRRRFWKGEYSQDKISAYQTLYTCLEHLAILASPIAPFFCDQLFCDLNSLTQRHAVSSVHLAQFPTHNDALIDLPLEYKMDLAQRATSLVLSLRKKERLKVRQPLQKLLIPSLDQKLTHAIIEVKDLILSEVNVKELAVIEDAKGILVKKIKPNFKTIGKKYGQQMKAIIALVAKFSQDDIADIETNENWQGIIDNQTIELEINDFEITTDDIPGWSVASDSTLTVALDITLNKGLIEEGIAREFVNRIQNIRKDSGLAVTDKIQLTIKSDEKINVAIENNLNYICAETLAASLNLVDSLDGEVAKVEIGIGIDETISSEIGISKSN